MPIHLPHNQDPNLNSSFKELLFVPPNKLAEHISKSIVKFKSEEINIVVDQMASFIDELKDFIDDRLIDTTSQLEMSNCHIYNLYKRINYLIDQLSSLKIQNEELKQELVTIQDQIKSDKLEERQAQQKNLIDNITSISCQASLKNDKLINKTVTSNTNKVLLKSCPEDLLSHVNNRRKLKYL